MDIRKKPLLPKISTGYEKKKPLEAKFSEPPLKKLNVSRLTTPRKATSPVPFDHVATATASNIDLSHSHSNRMPRSRMLQSFSLIWLDTHMSQTDPYLRDELDQLKRITGTVDTFHDIDQCISHVHTIQNMKTFLIVSHDLASHAIDQMHDLSQLESIYICPVDVSKDDPWTHQWTKVKGSFDKIETLFDVLKHDLRQSDRDSLSITVTSTSVNSLDPSFMYTQILKEIIIEQPYDEREKVAFVEFCRDLFQESPDALNIIDEFERGYEKYSPIWWYTRESFLYKLINGALRAEDFEIIIKMGFFLRDVHQQIQDLHATLVNRDRFTVYRGHGMSLSEFEKIQNSVDGLLAFNSFLSTTLNENISMGFAREASKKPNSVGIMFEMSIDPSILSTSFARVNDAGYYRDLEEEILFSMHTVFRINEIKEIEDHMWCIKLSSANVSDDRNLKRLIERVREETKGKSPMHRLSKLLTKAAKFVKAEEVSQLLVRDTAPDNLQELGQLYQQIGNIKRLRGEKQEALEYYQKALDAQLDILRWDHPELADTYYWLGILYESMGKSALALDSYRKALDIWETQNRPKYDTLAAVYSSMGSLYTHRTDVLNALDSYKKALANEKKCMSRNDPSFILTYNNIGSTYKTMKEFPRALIFFHKALDVCERLPIKNDQLLIQTYRNIGKTHKSMKDYSQALKYFHKIAEVEQSAPTINHLLLSDTYRHIGLLYYRLGQYSLSLEYYSKTLGIYQKYLPPNHMDKAMICSQIAESYESMRDADMAIHFYEQAILIGQEIWPKTDPYVRLWQTKLVRLNDRKCFLPPLEKRTG